MLYNRDTFLALPTEAIVALVQSLGKPKVGIYVPDGNRRFVLSETDLSEGSDEFFAQVARTQTTLGLNNLKVFFSHGLPILFAPIFSRSVLARGSRYHRSTVLQTLQTMLTSDEWSKFYEAFDVRVRVYGDWSTLAQEGSEQVLQSIEYVQQITQTHANHVLFLGIGGEPQTGQDAATAALRFYRTYQREPSRQELVEFIYGQPVPQADFFIMSSKFGGLGALPALICDGDTRVYYLPAPGVLALTMQTYRAILYDLFYMSDELSGERCYALNTEARTELRAWYTRHAQTVVGLGEKIGSVRVPAID